MAFSLAPFCMFTTGLLPQEMIPNLNEDGKSALTSYLILFYIVPLHVNATTPLSVIMDSPKSNLSTPCVSSVWTRPSKYWEHCDEIRDFGHLVFLLCNQCFFHFLHLINNLLIFFLGIVVLKQLGWTQNILQSSILKTLYFTITMSFLMKHLFTLRRIILK
jgi:hypothetical protein